MQTSTNFPGEQLTIYGLGIGVLVIAGRWMFGLAKDDAEQKERMRVELSELHKSQENLQKQLADSNTAWKVCEAERKQMQHEIDEIKKAMGGRVDG